MTEDDISPGEDVEKSPSPPAKAKRKRRSRSTTEKLKGYGALAGFIAWIGFLVVWLFFFAGSYGIFENLGVAIASFFIVAGILAMAFIPSSAGPTGSAWPVKLSVLSGIAWIVFMVLWLPFYAEFYNPYQNIVFVIVASLLVLILNIGVWGGMMRHEIGWKPTVTMFIFGGWMGFLIVWLWFFAISFTGYQNIAITLVSFLIVAIITWLFWKSEIKSDEGGEVKGLGFGAAWIIILSAWFWFFADSFDIYQNLAIVILSLVAFAGIAAYLGRSRWGSLSDLDWDEE